MSSNGGGMGSSAPSDAPAVSTSAGTRRSSGGGGAKKQRILWDSDSATRGGKTSIAVLLEWLTAPGNYARWRSGKSQFGETREALCSEIKAEMKLHGILHRENANIRTQISELERSYEVARAWMAKHGYTSDSLRQSSDDEALADSAAAAATSKTDADISGDAAASRSAIEATVLRLCRYFHVLDPIMRQIGDDAAVVRAKRPYAPRKRKERDADEQQAAGRAAGGATAKRDGGGRAADATNGTGRPTAAVTPKRDVDISPTQPPSAVGMPAAASPATPLPLGSFAVPDLSSLSMPMGSIPMAAPGLFPTWGNPALVSSFEESKRAFAEAAREERERKRKQFEWDEERARLEREKLRLDLETARLRLATERAVARRRMEDARVPAPEIERILATAGVGSH
jgi:hypothetical protein